MKEGFDLMFYLVTDKEIALGTGRIGFMGMAYPDCFHTVDNKRQALTYYDDDFS